jgi:hypothetical protein
VCVRIKRNVIVPGKIIFNIAYPTSNKNYFIKKGIAKLFEESLGRNIYWHSMISVLCGQGPSKRVFMCI